jgi:CubicO group peptidase (beta-lactamase class C family)
VPDQLARDLGAIAAAAQSGRRLPSLSAAVFRDGEVLWQSALGVADVASGERATPGHAYRIGSITKTFTAVCVLQLRDAGAVELDTELRAYVPEVPGNATVRQALAHLSGLQREPPGEIWETLVAPTGPALIASLREAERVLAPGEHWHYSNLAFGVLGELVARVTGSEYTAYLQQRVLDPLGLTRTAFTPAAPVARGYYVDPFSDTAHREPDVELSDSTAALGQLWSTTGDLAAWGTFLARGRDDVLDVATLDEMARVQTMADPVGWTVGWGLGLELYRSGDKVFAGHGGAMPGYLAGLVVDRADCTGAIVLASASTRAKSEELALDLLLATARAWPRAPAEWRPDGGPPAEVAPLLGDWWIEGNRLVISFRDGRLQAELVSGPPGRNVSWFAQEAPDAFRVVEGRERGEALRVVRDGDGEIVKLYLATYPVTRAPTTFGSV